MKSARPPRLPAHAAVVRLRCAGVADPLAPHDGPADVLVELGPENARGRRATLVLAVGPSRAVDAHAAAGGATLVDLGDSVLLPGLVNAHTHLDLTHLGPLPHRPEDGFVAWIERIRLGRAREDAGIAASVQRGIELSLAGGTVLVGDIAGAPAGRASLVPAETLAGSALRGVSFVEFFAIGAREAETLDRVEGLLEAARGRSLGGGTRLGVQPHAPNTVSLAGYRRAGEWSRRWDLPLATHLAETPEEREFVSLGSGPQREMLERLGVWSDSVLEHVGRGRTPVEHLAPVLAESRYLLAHVNDPGPEPERAIEILAASGASVAYCPRASEYFGAAGHFGPHRYREMLRAGVNVCLGTDSVANLARGCERADGCGMSVLDEARLLFRRDGAEASTLLRMATVNGGQALGWGESAFSLASGSRPLGIVSVEVGRAASGPSAFALALSSDAPTRLLVVGE